MRSFEGRLSGANGCFIIDDTNAHTSLDYDTLIAREDTVVSVCTGEDEDGNAVDFKVVHNWDSLKQNDLLLVPIGQKITAITLTSGSLLCY